MTCDTWHVIPDTWHVTCHTWHVTYGVGWISPNILAPKLLRFWMNRVLNIMNKRMTQSMNQWNNYKGVCRTDLATPVLLITLLICEAAGIAMTIKLCLIQEPLSCDQFALGLIALNWKVPDILARTWLKIFKGKIHYFKFWRTYAHLP